MPIRLSRFEMPRAVKKDEATATGTYARFTAEPFEIGYARTIGNSLRTSSRRFRASRKTLRTLSST